MPCVCKSEKKLSEKQFDNVLKNTKLAGCYLTENNSHHTYIFKGNVSHEKEIILKKYGLEIISY